MIKFIIFIFSKSKHNLLMCIILHQPMQLLKPQNLRWLIFKVSQDSIVSPVQGQQGHTCFTKQNMLVKVIRSRLSVNWGTATRFFSCYVVLTRKTTYTVDSPRCLCNTPEWGASGNVVIYNEQMGQGRNVMCCFVMKSNRCMCAKKGLRCMYLFVYYCFVYYRKKITLEGKVISWCDHRRLPSSRFK